MPRSKRPITISDFFLMGIQFMGICLWYYLLSRYDLVSKDGYVYSMYNGLYFLCAALAVLAMISNFSHGTDGSRKEQIVVCIGAGLYDLATILGNYPVFFPLSPAHTSTNLIVSLIGGFAVGYQILKWALRRLPLKGKQEARPRGTKVFFLSFLSVAAVYLLYFFCAAYPGYFSRDSFAAIWQSTTGNYDNTSPFWHTMLVKLCLEIGAALGGQGNSAVCVYGIVQALMMAAIFAYAVTTLYQAGMPRWCIAIVYGMYALLSYNVIYAVTMWKDIPFSGAALLTVTALYRILKAIGRQNVNYGVFAIGGAAFCIMRTNGWYAYLVMTVVMALVLGKQNKKLLVILCAVLAATWLGNHPLLDAMGVEEGDFVEALAIPFQQVTRVVAEEGEISESDMEMIEEIFWIDRVKELHDPLIVDPMKFEAFRADRRDVLKENLGEYAILWLRLGWNNPWLYAKAWIDQTQGYWNAGYHYWITPLEGGENGGESEKFGITRPGLDNPVSRCFEAIFAFEQSFPPVVQPFYGIGFQVWILLFCLIVNGVKKRKEALLTLPIVVIVAGLWLGTPVFAEFRYAYPVFVTVPVLLPLTVFQSGENLDKI